VVRELGSERRETGRSISGEGVRALKGFDLSTRGPERTNQWYIGYSSRSKRQVATFGRITAESI
jgi:hypothetical protein